MPIMHLALGIVSIMHCMHHALYTSYIVRHCTHQRIMHCTHHKQYALCMVYIMFNSTHHWYSIRLVCSVQLLLKLVADWETNWLTGWKTNIATYRAAIEAKQNMSTDTFSFCHKICFAKECYLSNLTIYGLALWWILKDFCLAKFNLSQQ